MFGQIPDTAAVVEKATGVGWEAGMLAVLIVSFMGVIIYMAKRQNDHSDKEREATTEREKGHQVRLAQLEQTIHEIQKANNEQLVELVRDMIAAKAESNAVQSATRETLAELARVNGLLNGDIKEMCVLLKGNPCLLAGRARGAVKVVDLDGNEIKVSEGEQD